MDLNVVVEELKFPVHRLAKVLPASPSLCALWVKRGVPEARRDAVREDLDAFAQELIDIADDLKHGRVHWTEARKRALMSHNDVADALGVHEKSVRRWEKEQTGPRMGESKIRQSLCDELRRRAYAFRSAAA